MDSPAKRHNLPNSDSQCLQLSHPTPDECIKIWADTFASWGNCYGELPAYLQESKFMTTVPLAKDGGMTTWILVDKNLAPDDRDILCSCETFKKRTVVADSDGNLKEATIHGIASVFCPSLYRNRGYAARLLTELHKALANWQADHVIGSVLYSDIGSFYYARLGWKPDSRNMHIEFLPTKTPSSVSPQLINETRLRDLCQRDKEMIDKALSVPVEGSSRQTRLTIVPDMDHIGWHMSKEAFATNHLFGKIPETKGAIVGPPGRQVWAIWARRYYGRPDDALHNNVLYILRLVVEGDESANRPSDASTLEGSLDQEQVGHLEAVLCAAQAEAADWQLDRVKLWQPSPWVTKAISVGNIPHKVVERKEESVASARWYDTRDNGDLLPIWLNNERYSWC